MDLLDGVIVHVIVESNEFDSRIPLNLVWGLVEISDQIVANPDIKEVGDLDDHSLNTASPHIGQNAGNSTTICYP